MLVTQAHVRPGETVLIHAAGAGVSVAGIQIAKLVGATVFATASSDATIKLWAVPSGREVATLQGHLTGVSAVAIAPDARTLVSIEPSQGLRFWDLPTLREVAVVPLPKAGEWLAFDPDGKTLAVDLNDGSVCLLKAP